MKLNLKLLLALTVAALVMGAQAHAQEVKIGIVDVDQAINATQQGKKARDELERKGREAEAQLKPLVDRYKALGQELEAKKFVLSEDALLEKRGELVNLEATIKSKQQQLQASLKVDQAKLVTPLQKKLAETIAAIGKEEGFTVILERNAPFVMYAREALDITDQVVARFNGQ